MTPARDPKQGNLFGLKVNTRESPREQALCGEKINGAYWKCFRFVFCSNFHALKTKPNGFLINQCFSSKSAKLLVLESGHLLRIEKHRKHKEKHRKYNHRTS